MLVAVVPGRVRVVPGPGRDDRGRQGMSAWTPGLWKAELHRNGGATIRKVGDDAANERGAIASLTFGKQEEIKADARMIALAPEMAELIQNLANGWTRYEDHGDTAQVSERAAALQDLLGRYRKDASVLLRRLDGAV